MLADMRWLPETGPTHITDADHQAAASGVPSSDTQSDTTHLGLRRQQQQGAPPTEKAQAAF